MDMKKTAKKIAALVAGTTMLGATIMGATALDLSNYPAPFVTNGVFSGKIVVGAKAATQDVVGAIDIAASLQADAITSNEVELPGAAGEASVSGDAAEFTASNDVLGLTEAVKNVKATFTTDDLKALKSGVLQTGTSSTPVKQYLRFDKSDMNVQYVEDSDNDKLADYLVVPSGSTVFEYHLEFTEGATSDVEVETGADQLSDLENEVLTILGAPFTIVDATVDGQEVMLSLLGGQVADVLRDGETKTYTIDGVDYEVTAVFISDSPAEAKLSVNGVMTKSLESGQTQVLGNDVTVGVQSVMTNNREGIVEFYLGANKLELTDANYTNSAYASGAVEVKGEGVDNEGLIIKATLSGSDLTLNYIKINITADDTYYVPTGKGVKEFVEADNEGAFLTDTWDIKYAGLVKTESNPIKVEPKSDYAYELRFTNNDGDAYSVPYLSNKAGAANLFGASNGDNLWFVEANTTNFPIGDNDYFVVSDKDVATNDKAVTRVMRFMDLNTGDSTITFKDIAGDETTVSYTSNTGELIVDGVSHTFTLSGTALRLDLDGDGTITSGDEVVLVAKGGAIIDLGTQTQASGAAGTQQNVTITTNADRFDEGALETSQFAVNLLASPANTVDLGSFLVNGVSLLSDPDDDDLSKGYTDYGAFYTTDSSGDAKSLVIDYPATQKYAQVFVTAGTVEVKEGAASQGGKLTTDNVNPIAVGLAVLDTEAPEVGSAKMIVVGGPCANTKAAELMGNPADCAAGFTPGKAIIKLFADKNALLVAGYSAQDTLGASYVLADAKDYKLSGTEVEVVVADLKNIDVKVVQ